MFKQKICYEIWGGESGKYRLIDNEGNPIDQTPEDTCKRVSRALANVETKDQDKWFDEFNKIMGTKFAGGGRIMANAGSKAYKKEVSLINCVVSSQIADSMESIMDVAKEAALVLKSGCGIGYDFSPLRPKGAHVFGAGAGTSGVVSFMKVFDTICSTILSGGGRRGSQLGALDVQHPDIEDFISAKRQDGCLSYMNVSALITDAFMKAVKNKDKWELWFWQKDRNEKKINDKQIKLIKREDIPFNYPEYNYFKFAEDHVEVQYKNCTTETIFVKKIYKTMSAVELFEKITKSTYMYNDPGILFIDRINFENNLYFTEVIRTTNPCVTGDTRLHTDNGMVTVKELYDSQKEIKCIVDNRTLDGGLGVSIRDAVPVFKTAEIANIYNVKTKAGYEIKVTKWHEFFTPRGKIQLQDLTIGDVLYIQSGEGKFGDKGSYDLGFIYGMIVGDGHFYKKDKIHSASIALWGKDKELAPKIKQMVKSIIGKTKYKFNFSIVEKLDKMVLTSKLLADEYIKLGVNPTNKYILPEFIWQGTRECVVGFLQGLFQNHKESRASIRLNSSELELLKQVQMLLSNFGIFAPYYLRRKKQMKMMPNNHGSNSFYQCKDNYDLIIGSKSRDIFMKEIGFALPYKSANYKSLKNHKQKFETQIVSISLVGQEPVYDTTQSDRHGVIFNGIVTSQCGEIPLCPNANCLLGSMILPSYIQDNNFDWESFKRDIRIANCALDNVVEINNLPLEILSATLKNKRRHGLGFTGLGSLFNLIGIAYGSQESVDFAERLMLTMAQESLLENIKVAKEKGCAPIFESQSSREQVMKSGYMFRLLNTFDNKQEIIDQIMKYGLRWSHATSVAPTGTMSLTWGNNCSNGIEPVFANSYLRNFRMAGKKTKTQEEVFDYAYYEWIQNHTSINEKLPDHWRVAKDLTIEDHIKVQAAVQKWCDSSISKTINIPTDYPYDNFKEVYFIAYENGLKGTTTYRPNSERGSGILLQKETLDNMSITFTQEDGVEIIVKGSDTVFYDGEEHIAANLYDALKNNLYGNM